MKHSALLLLALGSCGADPAAPTSGQDSTVRGAPEPARSSGWFTDVTDAWGVDFVHDAGFSAEKQLPETMGGGVVVLDVEGDGDLDLYFVQSGPLPIPQDAARGADVPPNQLYRNDGRGALHDATDDLGAGAHRGYGQGATTGDIDGDGDADLYVTNFGPDALLIGDGTGGFVERTAAAGLGDARWTAGCVLFDADGDGDLDLYVSAYVDLDPMQPAWCGRREPGSRSYCHPDHYGGLADRFWRNRGDGTFNDDTEAAGLADNAGKGLGALAADFDGDGHLDLYIANDSVENRLWRNRGDGTFEDNTLLSGTGVNGRGATEAGMGLAAGDVDGDLDLDLFVTNFDDESNTLYRGEDGAFFEDVTAAWGLDAPSRLPVGFGTVLEDFDADGDLDLAVANGHIIDNIPLYHDGKTWAQDLHLYVNEKTRFRLAADEAGDLAARPHVGRALVSGDLDGDGDADLVLVACGGAARVFRNENPTAGLVVVRGLPAGTQVVARTAAGAILRVAGPWPTYFGATEDGVRFAAAATIDALELVLPGGERERWSDLPASPATLVRTGEGGFDVRGGDD